MALQVSAQTWLLAAKRTLNLSLELILAYFDLSKLWTTAHVSSTGVSKLLSENTGNSAGKAYFRK